MVAEDNAIHFRPGTGDFLAENNINGNNSYHYNYLSLFVYLGYVESMKNLLFSLSLSTLKEVAERYSAKVPKPLCAGFPDRVDKGTALKNYQARAKRKNTLIPASMYYKH